MGLLDVILLLLIVIAFITGLRNGFIKELGKIIGIVLGIYLAINFTGFTIEKIGIEGKYQYEIAFFITLIAVIIGVAILSKLLTKFINIVCLGPINKILGGILSCITLTLILSILLELFYSFNLKANFIDKDFFNNSFMFSIMNKISDMIFPFIGEYISMSKDFFNELID